MGPVRQNPTQRPVSLFICVCIALCTIVAHNIAQNRPDSFPPYPPDDHHYSDDVYLREGGGSGWMKTPLDAEVDLGAGHIELDRVPAPAKGAQYPIFSAHLYCGHGRPSQLLLSSCCVCVMRTPVYCMRVWDCNMMRWIWWD